MTFTRDQLIQRRIAMLKSFKTELREQTGRPKAEKFRQFKQLCRDRHFDAVAGFTESPRGSGVFKKTWG